MSNLVVHFELHASDPEKLIDFYGELFGWRFERFGDVPYWTIDTGEGVGGPGRPGFGINGGLTQRRGPSPEVGGPVNGCNIVVGVDGDIDAVYARGLELGGTEAMPLDDMPGVGRLGYLLDPDGNVFGMITPTLSDGSTAMGPA